MKLEEFNHPEMHWEMTEKSPLDDLEDRMEAGGRQETGEEYLAALNATVMVIETDAPPGIHDFHVDGMAPERRFHGIVVNENGELDPNLTAHAVYIAQRALDLEFWSADEPIHHVFIEDISWDPEMNAFIVGNGS